MDSHLESARQLLDSETSNHFSDTDWPEPVNIFSELSASPYQASKVPAEIGDYARLYAAQTGIDISLAITAAVSASAGALSDQIQLCADSGSRWFVQARLWLLAIGAPGAGKSPAQRAMLEPIWTLHRKLEAEWRDACSALPKEEPRPPRPRIIVADATLEALSNVLVDNPRGVLVANDEFDAWIGSLDQYKSGGIGRDRGEWLRLFDGGPHSIERIQRGSMFVPNWGVSILTATTPAAIRRLARHLPEDGLIQRFLIVCAQRQNLETGNTVSPVELDAAHQRYSETLRRLFALRPCAHNGIVSLSFAAKQRFDIWRKENLATQEAFGGIAPALEAHLAKYPTLALRLALVFHCARTVNIENPEAHDPATSHVTLETMEQAISFLRYATRHALVLYLNQKGASEGYELVGHIARFVLSRTPEQNAEGLQRRDLLRRVHQYQGADERVQASAIRLLGDLGWIRPREDVGYQKAHPTRFTVNPTLHARFADLAKRERERRAIARELIAESANDRRNDRQDG